jgi:hypothetical protein
MLTIRFSEQAKGERMILQFKAGKTLGLKECLKDIYIYFLSKELAEFEHT